MSTAVGNQAESVAADYLIGIGHEILDRNWRTRVCEIDIVSSYRGVIHFVEVKYRSTQGQGTGLDYITPKKLTQMQFAAQCWVEDAKWSGDYVLSAVEVGHDFTVTHYLQSLT